MNECKMNQAEIKELLGETLYEVWNDICSLIESKYEMDKLWGSGGKKWRYEYKYRRGVKNTLFTVHQSELSWLLACSGQART